MVSPKEEKMCKVCPLFSGSEGNSTYVKVKNISFLIDAGRSCKQIENSVIKNGFNPNDIKFIFVTHEHSDHVKGLRVFAKKFGIKIYASKGTISELENKNILGKEIEYEIIEKSGTNIDNISVIPFETSHDCSQGYGYTFFINEKKLKISFCSDLGMVSNEVLNSILGSNLIFMESNHDIEMLKNGPYPWYLKKRILSDTGHLSNNACSEVLNKLILSGTKKFVLCHLSSTNNTPEVAYNSAFKVLENTGIKDFELYVAPKENIGKININI